MHRFIEPETVAVIGASANPSKGGYDLVVNLKEGLAEGVYPVNPVHREICGLPCYRDVESLPEVVDLAIVFVPAPLVPGILEQCGMKGIQRVMIQSAGFAETGAQGRLLQEQCLEIAGKYGIRLWGPNCMGVVNGRTGVVSSFMRPGIWKGRLKPGGVSLIVQSGLLSAGFLLQILSEGSFGLSKACSIGNRCDVNECDLLEYFCDDPATEVLALYLESISDAGRFRRAVSRLNRPVVIVKGGMSAEGARAALSHTGSLSGNGRLAEGFFRQLGIHQAWDFVEWMDLAKALVLWRGRKGGPRMAVITFSGASGIVSTDHFVRRGMTLAPLSAQTIQQLKTVFPPWMEPQNPVDIWPAVERAGRQAYATALEAVVRDPQVDGIYVHLYVDRALLQDVLEFLGPLRGCRKPAAIWVVGDTSCFRALREAAEGMGIAVYREIERGIRALSLFAHPSK